MAYIQIPKDLAQVKAKVVFNLTARQLLCFGGGVLVGLPLYFLLKDALPNSIAIILMILVMMPFLLLGMYERNGQPLEKILHYYIQSRFIRPKKRPYRTQNAYAALMRQAELDKEVKRIVQGTSRQAQSPKQNQSQSEQG